MSSRFDPNLLLAPQMAFGSFAGARQAQQEQQAIDLNRLKLRQAEQAMQQQQELAPIMQQLRELELQAAQTAAPFQQRQLEQQQQATDIANTVAQFEALGKIAAPALNLEGVELDSYVERVRPALNQLGVSPDDPITSDDVKMIATSNQVLNKLKGNEIQQAKYIDGLGFIQQLKSGDVRLKELTPDQQEKVKQANELQADLKAEATRKETEAREGAKSDQKIEDDIVENALVAQRAIPKINQLIEGVSLIGTGKAQQAKKVLGSFLPGIDPTNEQALNAALNELIFEQLAQFKGALSDGEREFARETISNMGNTTEANLIILRRLKRKSEDAVEERTQFKDFKKGGGKASDFIFEAPDRPFFVTERLQSQQVQQQTQEMADDDYQSRLERALSE